MATRKKRQPASRKLYTLDVYLISGLVTEGFAKANPVVKRTIEIRGDQTLADLHRAIFEAHDREEEHMFEFEFGDGPTDPAGTRYVLSVEEDSFFSNPDEKPVGDLTTTTLDELELEEGQSFWYWFDFGDDWRHEIDVAAIGKTTPRTLYPRIVARQGESPPQYIDWDEEDEEEEDEDHDEEE